MSNFIKILPVGVELFHADGRADMTKSIVAFRNFANAPKIITTLAVLVSIQTQSNCRMESEESNDLKKTQKKVCNSNTAELGIEPHIVQMILTR